MVCLGPLKQVTFQNAEEENLTHYNVLYDALSTGVKVSQMTQNGILAPFLNIIKLKKLFQIMSVSFSFHVLQPSCPPR